MGERACRSRSTASRCRLTELIRQPRDHRGRARRRPHRHGRKPPGRHQVARDLRSAGRPSCFTRRIASSKASSSRGPPAAEAAPLAGLRRPRLQRPLVFARRARRSTRSCRTSSSASAGTVRLKLYKGDCRVVGRKSPFALYDHGLATYDEGDRFDHSAAEGFIKIWGLPVETAAKKRDGEAPAAENRARSRAGDEVARWRISGQDVSAASPIPTPSSSGRRFRFDRRLFEDDVTGSLAWVEGLAGVGVFDSAEAEMVAAALTDILDRGRREPAFVDGSRRRRARVRRAPARRARRRSRQAPAYRPLAQRAGLARSAAVPQAADSRSCSGSSPR